MAQEWLSTQATSSEPVHHQLSHLPSYLTKQRGSQGCSAPTIWPECNQPYPGTVASLKPRSTWHLFVLVYSRSGKFPTYRLQNPAKCSSTLTWALLILSFEGCKSLENSGLC